MKTKQVTLQRAGNGPNGETLYQSVQLVNCIEPTVGTLLTKVEAGQLIARRDTKVTIKRAKA
jgi:hypothetical protein